MLTKRAVLWSSGLIVSLALGAVFGEQAIKAFKPPRTAVVDVSQIFEAYDKKRDRQEQFQAEIKVAEEKVKDLEKKVKEIAQELLNLETGDAKKDKELEKFSLERDIKDLKQSAMEQLRKKQSQYIEEIRDEIGVEINAYAQAQDLDLVIERTFLAEPGPEGGFRWKIVHFAKPEIDITTEIAERLNSRYKPVRATAPPQVSPQVGPPAPRDPGTPAPPKGAVKKP
jgi:Skp family chaperone for outer membrane proteins